MVEDEGFRQMIHILNPGYTLPSGTHFTKLMERKYKQTFQGVKSDTVISSEEYNKLDSVSYNLLYSEVVYWKENPTEHKNHI